MMQQTSIKKNISQISYMRIFACFAIVLLHILFSSSIYYKESMTKKDLLFEATTEHMLMWAVPIFIMITGALLLNPARKVTLNKLFSKYIKRIAISLIVFTFIFQLIDYFAGEQTDIFSTWLFKLFTGQTWPHIWYLYLMIGLYLMLPIYKLVTDKISDEMLLYLIIILLIFTSLLPMIGTFTVNSAFGIPTATIYPFYLFVGYYLYRKPIPIPIAIILFVASSTVIIWSSICQQNYNNDLAEKFNYFYKYSSIFVVGQTVGIFGILYRIPFKTNAFIKELDLSTFGIYLIHMIGVKFLLKWKGINPYDYNVGFFIIIAIILFFISFAISFCIRKIPKLNLL